MGVFVVCIRWSFITDLFLHWWHFLRMLFMLIRNCRIRQFTMWNFVCLLTKLVHWWPCRQGLGLLLSLDYAIIAEVLIHLNSLTRFKPRYRLPLINIHLLTNLLVLMQYHALLLFSINTEMFTHGRDAYAIFSRSFLLIVQLYTGSSWR